MKIILVLLTCAGFYLLASYSLEQHGYNATDRAGMDMLVASVQYDDTPESKIVYLYGDNGKF